MDRYWVGGSGTWDSSSTANWSTSSGGASGASVPTSVDNVIFDNGSDSGATYIVTVSGTVSCANYTVTTQDFLFTLSGTATPILQIYGSVSINAGGSNYQFSGATEARFLGSGSFTISVTGSTPGITNGAYTFNNTGGTWTLNSNLTCYNGVTTITAGTLALNGNTYTQTLTGLTVSAGGTISFGTGGVLLSTASSMTHTFTGTVTAGTGHVWMNGAGTQTFNGNGRTFYQVTLGNGNATSLVVTGANTYTNLIFGGSAAVSRTVTFSANQTITGALNFGGASPTTATNRRTVVTSDTFNTQRTISIATAQNVQTIDFCDIAVTGAASPISGSSVGDLAGNSGVTFTAAKTVYWVGGTGDWNADAATKWAASSGGSAAVTNYPLAQDTAVFDENSGTGSPVITYTTANNIGALNSSARTSALSFASSGIINVYGSISIGSGVTNLGDSALRFRNRSAVSISTSGLSSLNNAFRIQSVGSTVSLANNFTLGTGLTNLEYGTLDLAGFTLTIGSGFPFQSVSTATRVLALGSGSLVMTQEGFQVVGANFSCTGTGKISLTSVSAKTFAGAGYSYPHLENAGTGALTISGNNTFTTISNTIGVARTFTFTSGTTQTVTNFNVSGTLGALVTINATSTGNATLSKASGTVSVSYCNITKSTATGGATWRALIADGNVDGGSNTGWDFGPRGNGLFFGSNF